MNEYRPAVVWIKGVGREVVVVIKHNMGVSWGDRNALFLNFINFSGLVVTLYPV